MFVVQFEGTLISFSPLKGEKKSPSLKNMLKYFAKGIHCNLGDLKLYQKGI